MMQVAATKRWLTYKKFMILCFDCTSGGGWVHRLLQYSFMIFPKGLYNFSRRESAVVVLINSTLAWLVGATNGSILAISSSTLAKPTRLTDFWMTIVNHRFIGLSQENAAMSCPG